MYKKYMGKLVTVVWKDAASYNNLKLPMDKVAKATPLIETDEVGYFVNEENDAIRLASVRFRKDALFKKFTVIPTDLIVDIYEKEGFGIAITELKKEFFERFSNGKWEGTMWYSDDNIAKVWHFFETRLTCLPSNCQCKQNDKSLDHMFKDTLKDLDNI